MAFERKDFFSLGGASTGLTPQLWGYSTTDNDATILGAGYFDELVNEKDTSQNLVQAGDMIVCDTDTDGTQTAKMYSVTVSGASITIAAFGGGGSVSASNPWDTSPPAMPALSNRDNFEFFDDFAGGIINNLPVLWEDFVADTNGVISSRDDTLGGEANGVVRLGSNPGTSNEGYCCRLSRSVWGNAGAGKLYIEVKFQLSDADDYHFAFGIHEGGFTNPEDVIDSSVGSVMAFALEDGGGGTPVVRYRNSGGTLQSDASTVTLVDDTWYTAGLYWDGSTGLTIYIDGVLVATASNTSDVDTDILGTPFLYGRNGTSTSQNVFVDYFYLAAPRNS